MKGRGAQVFAQLRLRFQDSNREPPVGQEQCGAQSNGTGPHNDYAIIMHNIPYESRQAQHLSRLARSGEAPPCGKHECYEIMLVKALGRGAPTRRTPSLGQTKELIAMSKPNKIFPRHTKGKRPGFFADPALDQMMTFLIEMATELSVVRERLNTVELLLDERGTISRDDIETYRPSAATEQARSDERQALIERIFRMHPQ